MQQPSSHTTWQGQLWLASDFCLVAGSAGHTDEHTHYPHQVLIAREGEVDVTVDGQSRCGSVVLIESNLPHAILTGQPLISLFAEPLAFEPADLLHLCTQQGPDIDGLIRQLHDLPRRALPARLANAVQRIRQLDADTLPASVVASQAALSVSQLERLFSGQLGVSVRRLVLWQRLRFALQLALSGSNLTTAAATAGFADSAHLSRSIRRHFGVRADHTLRQLQLHVIGQGIAQTGR